MTILIRCPSLYQTKQTEVNMTAIPDPTTQSNYLSITTQHVHLDWFIDFVSKTISGSAIHSLIAKENVGEVMLVDQIIIYGSVHTTFNWLPSVNVLRYA